MRTYSMFAVGVFLMMLGVLAAARQVPRITPADVREHVGQTVTVCGTVDMGTCERGQASLLRLKTDPADARVSLAIPSGDRSRFGDRVETRYQGADVCATGRIERASGEHRIVVTTPDQIVIEREPAVASRDLTAFTVCDAGVSLPVALRQVRPQYTPDAMRALVRGAVRLQAIVDVDGAVRDVRVVESLEPSLDAEAAKAFAQWRFAPGKREGQAVPVLVYADFTFTLK